MNRSSPLSIAVPIYKPELRHLWQLLESVYRSPCIPEVEIVLHFDYYAGCSRDVREVRHLVDGNPNVKIIQTSCRLGMAENWNAAVRATSGEFVILPGQDDLFLEHGLCLLREVVVRRGLDLLGSHEVYGFGDGPAVKYYRKGLHRFELFAPKAEFDLSVESIARTAVCHSEAIGDPCAMIFRRTYFDFLGGFNSSWEHSVDIEFALRAAASGGRVGYVAEYTSLRRLHQSNATDSQRITGAIHRDRLRLLEACRPFVDIDTMRRGEAKTGLRLLGDVVKAPLQSRHLLRYLPGGLVLLKSGGLQNLRAEFRMLTRSREEPSVHLSSRRDHCAAYAWPAT